MIFVLASKGNQRAKSPLSLWDWPLALFLNFSRRINIVPLRHRQIWPHSPTRAWDPHVAQTLGCRRRRAASASESPVWCSDRRAFHLVPWGRNFILIECSYTRGMTDFFQLKERSGLVCRLLRLDVDGSANAKALNCQHNLSDLQYLF